MRRAVKSTSSLQPRACAVERFASVEADLSSDYGIILAYCLVQNPTSVVSFVCLLCALVL